MDVLGYGITVVLGILSIIFSQKMAAILGYGQGLSSLGLTEFKATYGIFFCTLGLLGLYFRTSEVNIVVGGAWISASVMRAIIVLRYKNDISKNIGGVIIEAGIGLLIALG